MTVAAEHHPLRKGALSALRSGRVSVIYSRTDNTLSVTQVIARVVSSRQGGPTYAVDFRDGEWRCTCAAAQKQEPCAHVHAVQLVTTGASA